THARTRWPDLAAVNVRYRGMFAYIDAQLGNGVTMPLCRLRYNASASIWGFAIYPSPAVSVSSGRSAWS
ncbi:MAG TPA: hypothetical protein VFQ37_14130, partial [Mycobacterium sp.]|nr:hypothetical protein [Mycobacterium sp.]